MSLSPRNGRMIPNDEHMLLLNICRAYVCCRVKYIRLPVISYLHFGSLKTYVCRLNQSQASISLKCFPLLTSTHCSLEPVKLLAACKDHSEFRRTRLHRHCPDTQTGNCRRGERSMKRGDCMCAVRVLWVLTNLYD